MGKATNQIATIKDIIPVGFPTLYFEKSDKLNKAVAVKDINKYCTCSITDPNKCIKYDSRNLLTNIYVPIAVSCSYIDSYNNFSRKANVEIEFICKQFTYGDDPVKTITNPVFNWNWEDTSNASSVSGGEITGLNGGVRGVANISVNASTSGGNNLLETTSCAYTTELWVWVMVSGGYVDHCTITLTDEDGNLYSTDDDEFKVLDVMGIPSSDIPSDFEYFAGPIGTGWRGWSFALAKLKAIDVAVVPRINL